MKRLILVTIVLVIGFGFSGHSAEEITVEINKENLIGLKKDNVLKDTMALVISTTKKGTIENVEILPIKKEMVELKWWQTPDGVVLIGVIVMIFTVILFVLVEKIFDKYFSGPCPGKYEYFDELKK